MVDGGGGDNEEIGYSDPWDSLPVPSSQPHNPSSDGDWIESAKELAGVDRPLEHGDYRIDLDHLEPEELDYLMDQTERTLDRHAEVQEYQMNQAMGVIRITLTIIAVSVAALPYVAEFIQSVNFAPTTSVWKGVGSGLTLMLIVTLSEQIVFDMISIIDSTFDILSPEATERGIVGRLLGMLGLIGPEVWDKESGATIRSASILDELAPAVDKPRSGLQREILNNRHNRIRRNERVIDQNTEHLHGIYQRAKLGLERAVAIIALLMVLSWLLGVSL